MRTSGGRGADGWIMAIPILALIVASTMSAGGIDGMLIMLEGVVRTTITSVVDFVTGTLLEGDSAGGSSRESYLWHTIRSGLTTCWREMSACSGSREWRWSRRCAASSRPRSGADGVFPGASQITLASDGTVTIGGAAATRAVPAAGHLLARMLSDDAPVRLRLLVTQATAEDATSGSLHEFSESLAYFERPNPEAILSALHARAAVAPPARRQEAEIAEPVAERTPRASSPEPRARKRRRPIVLAAAAILLLAVTGLFVRAGLRNGRLASVVEGLKSAVADAGRSHGTDTAAQGQGDAREQARRRPRPLAPRPRGGHADRPSPWCPRAPSRFRPRSGRRHGS